MKTTETAATQIHDSIERHRAYKAQLKALNILKHHQTLDGVRYTKAEVKEMTAHVLKEEKTL